jgi:hypothetical protein
MPHQSYQMIAMANKTLTGFFTISVQFARQIAAVPFCYSKNEDSGK